MSSRLDALLELVRRALIEPLGRLGAVMAGAVRAFFAAACRLRLRPPHDTVTAIRRLAARTDPSRCPTVPLQSGQSDRAQRLG